MSNNNANIAGTENPSGSSNSKFTVAPMSWHINPELDEDTIAKHVNDVIETLGVPAGLFQASEANPKNDETEDSLFRQFCTNSLQRGYFSDAPIAVDIDGRLDVEYGNRGPEISMKQQTTNTGFLSAINEEEIRSTEKQQRYRTLSQFPRQVFGDALLEEFRALEEDDDVHSVSVVSNGVRYDPTDLKHCSIDCWLKTQCFAEESEPALLASFTALCVNVTEVPEVYTDTKLDRYETRILSILPGCDSDPIFCRLSTMAIPQPELRGGLSQSAYEQQPYEALSYTWGDPTRHSPVILDGISALVPRSAFLAMQHLRQEQQPRTIWIDAICINQQDNEEKSEQVSHMLQIYKHASRVVVWLGEGFEHSHLAFTSMKYLDVEGNRSDILRRIHDESCYSHLKRIYIAQYKVFESRWFRRSWIRQEIMVSKDVVVICGQDSINWYTMKRSLGRLRQLYETLQRGGVTDAEEYNHDNYTEIESLARGWIYGLGGFLDLLMSSRGYGATDPRDKVYSVLGLARVRMVTNGHRVPPGTVALPVDYDRSVSEVYQDVVKYFINRDKNLDVLTLLLVARNASSEGDLPSWAPDWRVPASEVSMTANWDFISFKFAAGGFSSEAQQQSYEEEGILRVQGYMITEIQTLLDYTAPVAGVLRSLATFNEAHGMEISDEEIAIHDAEPFDARNHRTRCCLTTPQGHVCLAPSNTEAGDTVAIFLGAKNSFIIRPLDFIEEDGQMYTVARVVGPCVMPVVMFGSSVKTARELGIEPLSLVLV